jgi:hypothetical protein
MEVVGGSPVWFARARRIHAQEATSTMPAHRAAADKRVGQPASGRAFLQQGARKVNEPKG